MAYRVTLTDDFPESTTRVLTCQATQEDGVTALADTDFSTLTLTLHQDGQVVNGKEDVNILNANNGTVDGSGNIELTLLAADTAIADATKAREFRTALFQWTWASGAKHGAVEVVFRLVNLVQYP